MSSKPGGQQDAQPVGGREAEPITSQPSVIARAILTLSTPTDHCTFRYLIFAFKSIHSHSLYTDH